MISLRLNIPHHCVKIFLSALPNVPWIISFPGKLMVTGTILGPVWIPGTVLILSEFPSQSWGVSSHTGTHKYSIEEQRLALYRSLKFFCPVCLFLGIFISELYLSPCSQTNGSSLKLRESAWLSLSFPSFYHGLETLSRQ